MAKNAESPVEAIAELPEGDGPVKPDTAPKAPLKAPESVVAVEQDNYAVLGERYGLDAHALHALNLEAAVRPGMTVRLK
ncbi:MAG TPA: hypothetical protein VK149_04290 [Sideroxyarcus sp.]|nr:hypothetical protein [Sideroxyarcus sp.]